MPAQPAQRSPCEGEIYIILDRQWRSDLKHQGLGINNTLCSVMSSPSPAAPAPPSPEDMYVFIFVTLSIIKTLIILAFPQPRAVLHRRCVRIFLAKPSGR